MLFVFQVHAYAVCDSPEYFYDYVQGLIDGLNAGVKSEDIVRIINVRLFPFFPVLYYIRAYLRSLDLL